MAYLVVACNWQKLYMPMRYLWKDKIKPSHKASPVCQRSLVVGRNNRCFKKNNTWPAITLHCCEEQKPRKKHANGFYWWCCAGLLCRKIWWIPVKSLSNVAEKAYGVIWLCNNESLCCTLLLVAKVSSMLNPLAVKRLVRPNFQQCNAKNQKIVCTDWTAETNQMKVDEQSGGWLRV